MALLFVSVPCRGCLSSDNRGKAEDRQKNVSVPCRGCLSSDSLKRQKWSGLGFSPLQGVSVFRHHLPKVPRLFSFQSPAGGVCLQTLQFLTPDFQRTYKRKIQHPLSFCPITAKIR